MLKVVAAPLAFLGLLAVYGSAMGGAVLWMCSKEKLFPAAVLLLGIGFWGIGMMLWQLFRWLLGASSFSGVRRPRNPRWKYVAWLRPPYMWPASCLALLVCCCYVPAESLMG